MSAFIKKYFLQQPSQPGKPNFPVKYALHLNEMPENMPIKLRQTIAERIADVPFNRYPDPFGQSLIGPLAEWYHCDPKKIMIAPGSSAFIRLLIGYFGLNKKGKIVITRPSFTYYEQYCETYHIPFEQWSLDEKFDYVPERLKDLPDYSIVFLTTPNNPTGNIISLDTMRDLLITHNKSLFVVDEAYAEFVNQTMMPLIEEHDNIVLLRTFSKAFCGAGVRCGVLFAQESMVQALLNLQTPWQLTPFTLETVKALLEFASKDPWFKEQVMNVIAERDALFNRLIGLNSKKYLFFPSQANFLLLKSENENAHQSLLQACAIRGIIIKDLSNEPMLENYARVTIGLREANDAFYKAVMKANEEKS